MADPEHRRRTALAILALAHATPTIASLGIDPDTMQLNHETARTLLEQL
jgi:hypothetical protein